MIFAVTIYAQRPFGSGFTVSYGTRAIRAADKDAARVLAEENGAENWPKSEGWQVQYSFADIPHSWILSEAALELANSK